MLMLLDRKLTIKITIFLLLSSLMMEQAYAHYTLGNQGSSGPTFPMGNNAGYVSQSKNVATTWGVESTGNNFWLEESGIPVFEFPYCLPALMSALVASFFLIRWRRESHF